MLVLPTELAHYSLYIFLGFLAFDGLLIGVAVRKAASSILLLAAGILFAAYLGLNLPFPSANSILGEAAAFLVSQATNAGSLVYALPAFWLLGFGIGLWKG